MTMVSQNRHSIPVPSPHDIMNESFHEQRPSFRTLLSKFEHNKGSFSYAVTKNTSIRELMQEQKSVRLFNKSHGKLSLASSISGDLDFLQEEEINIIEEDEEEEEYDESEEQQGQEENMVDAVVQEEADELVIEENEEGENDEPVEEAPVPERAPKRSSLKSSEKKKKKKKKKGPTFATERFDDCYVLGEELGSGAYAVVKEGTNRRTGKSYAIKIVEIECMDQADLDALQIEISVMAKLNHPNIIHLYETYSESDFYFLVTEKMLGGELLDRVVQKTFYNEKEARDTCTILFQAMSYCHSKRIAHRDLKPENLLLTSNDCDSDIKIADFGFAKKCPREGLKTMCGTPGYVAPEILERTAYNTQCDTWSLGVIVYILLGGYSPFEEKSQDLLFQRIRAGDYTFHEEFWDFVSDDAKDFIRALLTVDPKKRLTAEEALQHKWMTVSDDVLASMDLGANLTVLKRFNAKRKFKAAVKTVIATQKLTSLFLSC